MQYGLPWGQRIAMSMYDSRANGLKRLLGMKTASPQDVARHPYTSVAVAASSRRRIPGWKGEAFVEERCCTINDACLGSQLPQLASLETQWVLVLLFVPCVDVDNLPLDCLPKCQQIMIMLT